MRMTASPSTAIASTANAHGAISAHSSGDRSCSAPAAGDTAGDCAAGAAIGISAVVLGTVAAANASKSDTANAASATAASKRVERSCGLFKPADDSMMMRTIEQRDDALRN